MHINNIQQKQLNSIVESRQPHKQIFFDFDGIFSSTMVYNATTKIAKSAQFSARYAIEMLRYYGFEVYVITGDQSGSGFDITNAILSRVPVTNVLYVPGHKKYSYLKYNYDIDKIFYAGDDLYDMSMYEPIFITTQNAFAGIKTIADYITMSSSADYSVLEIANAILESFGIDTQSYSDKSRYNLFVDIKNAVHYNHKVVMHVNNSQLLNTVYTDILSAYSLRLSEIDAIVASELAYPQLSNDTIHIITDLVQFANTSTTFDNRQTYLIITDDIDLYDLNIQNAFTALDKAYSDNSMICLLTKHLHWKTIIKLYKHFMQSHLYNMLSMLDLLFDDINAIILAHPDYIWPELPEEPVEPVEPENPHVYDDVNEQLTQAKTTYDEYSTNIQNVTLLYNTLVNQKPDFDATQLLNRLHTNMDKLQLVDASIIDVSNLIDSKSTLADIQPLLTAIYNNLQKIETAIQALTNDIQSAIDFVPTPELPKKLQQ